MHGHITVAPQSYYSQVYIYYACCQALNNNIYTKIAVLVEYNLKMRQSTFVPALKLMLWNMVKPSNNLSSKALDNNF